MKIGLEIHVQLPTRSKLFCSCSTSSDSPNSSICPVCLGFPGSRPRLNRRALEMGVLIAKYLQCKVADTVWFSRKTYFYPDLPKNFQITQYDSPLGTDGKFMIGQKPIGIWRAHLEEDPGRIKRVGRSGEELALIDYDRSGIPLVEIVTAPDMSSPAEARDFLTDLLIEMRSLIGVSGEDTSIRADANISVGEERVEVKNITGIRNVEKALKFEATRQSKLIAAGKKIVRETRHYDEERGVTMPGREKEFEEDYGYIGEPDLGVFHIGEIAARMAVPETPLARAARLEGQYAVPAAAARQMVLTSMELTDMFERLAYTAGVEAATSWTLGPLSANWKGLSPRMSPELRSSVEEIVVSVSKGPMTDSEGKLRIAALAEGRELEAGAAPEAGGSDLDQLIAALVDAHPEVVRDFKTNEKAANFLIGQAMKGTRGRYSSKEIAEKMRKELGKRV